MCSTASRSVSPAALSSPKSRRRSPASEHSISCSLVLRSSEAAFDRQFSVNTRGSFFVVQRLAKHLNPEGSITLTTVTTAPASRGMSVYLASKAAVRAYAQGLAAELVQRRIRVNTIAPGFIDTPTLGLTGLSPSARAEFRKIGDQVTPMQRHGTVEEVALAALFLAFDATFTTGAELPVDGGIAQIEAPTPPAV